MSSASSSLSSLSSSTMSHPMCNFSWMAEAESLGRRLEDVAERDNVITIYIESS
jgi:hypothetical protein